MECLNLLIISSELKLISEDELINVKNEIEEISKKLSNYRRSQLIP